MQRLRLPFKAIWNKSWTKLLGWLQGVSGAVLIALSELNQYLSDPTFKSYLGQLDIPKEVSMTIVLIGMITWLAHGREND